MLKNGAVLLLGPSVSIYELNRNGLKTKAELPVPIVYETERLEIGYLLDILVEESVVVEVKSIEKLAPIHKGN